MIRPKVTTIGSSILDTFFYTEQGKVIENKEDVLCCEFLAFEKAAKISASAVHTTYGGGAANTATTFSKLGIPVQILTAIGTDAIGKEMMLELRSNGIGTKLVQFPKDCSTAMSFIPTLKGTGDHVVFVSRGASSHLQITERISKKVTTPFVYLTSLSGQWKVSLQHIFKQVDRKRQKLIWNPGGRQLRAPFSAIKKFLPNVWILLLNRDEAVELCMSAGVKKDMKRISGGSLARSIHALGPEIVVVTDGHKGSYAYDGKRVYFQKAKKVSVVNKTGAGDAFGSAFTVGMINGVPIQKSLALGAENSASVVKGMGAQVGIISRARSRKFLTK